MQLLCVPFFSAPGRFRTCGHRFKGPPLCRLSYGCVPGGDCPFSLSGKVIITPERHRFPEKKLRIKLRGAVPDGTGKNSIAFSSGLSMTRPGSLTICTACLRDCTARWLPTLKPTATPGREFLIVQIRFIKSNPKRTDTGGVFHFRHDRRNGFRRKRPAGAEQR